MDHNQTRYLSARLGFWAASLGATAFLLYTVAFVAIIMTGPLLTWSGLPDYLAAIQERNQFWKELAQLCMLLFAPLFVILLHSICELAPPAKMPLARIGRSFGVIFATLFTMLYFVQLSTVRLGIAHSATQGLEQFIQLRPYSAIGAINMLGSSLFLGLASLFVAPLFGGDRLGRLIRAALLANGLICLAGGAAYLLDNTLLVFLLTTFGLGGALLLALLALALFMRRAALACAQGQQPLATRLSG